MKQHIKIVVQSFQADGRVIQGEVLQWCQAVASFDGQHMQVPAVTVRRGDEVMTVPLQVQHAHTQVSIWDEA